MKILLDTNALLWFELDDPRLGRAAARLISNATATGNASLCPIIFWEIELAVQRKRVVLDQPVGVWRHFLLSSGYIERPITGDDTILMAQLEGFHADPADRLITAVAINGGFSLVTSDQKILDWNGSLTRISSRV